MPDSNFGSALIWFYQFVEDLCVDTHCKRTPDLAERTVGWHSASWARDSINSTWPEHFREVLSNYLSQKAFFCALWGKNSVWILWLLMFVVCIQIGRPVTAFRFWSSFQNAEYEYQWQRRGPSVFTVAPRLRETVQRLLAKACGCYVCVL